MQKLECGAGFSLVRWNNLVIASCYNSCNCTIREYNAFLDALHLVLVGHVNAPMLVLGDFNAHHSEWNRRKTDARGWLLKDWFDNLGLFVLNTEYIATCRRPQGETVIDLCIANSLAADMIYRLCKAGVNVF